MGMGTQTNSDNQLIESIVYLSSLVSDPLAIDSRLDTLRSITARMRPDGVSGAPMLTEVDKTALYTLRHDLESYLITQDPVRSFTRESLQQRVAHHISSLDPLGHARRDVLTQLFIIFALALAVYAVGILLTPGAVTMRSMLAAPLFLVQLHAGLAWLFWSARKELVAALRVAYNYIGAGLLMSALGSVQFPILFAKPELTQQALFRYAGFMPLFPVMCMLFYVGLYIYARQLPEIKIRFLQLHWVMLGAAVIGVAVVVLPHTVHVPEEAFFDVSLVSTALSVYFSVPAALLGFAIVRHVTNRYAQGMRLFAAAQFAVAFACSVFFVVLYVSGPISGLKVAVSALPFALSEGLMLVAAYLFKRNVME